MILPSLRNPLLEYLGARLVSWNVRECEFQLTIGPEHLNRQSILHGGVIAALLDAACGYAGLMQSGEAEPGNASTVMLTISYLDKTAGGQVRAKGRVTKSGRNLYFAAGELVTQDERLLATAQGTFKYASRRNAESGGSVDSSTQIR